jgi:hypothetical protein
MTMQELLKKASKAGYTIETTNESTNVVRRHKRTNAVLNGITIFADKTAYQMNVSLDAAKTLRNVASMAKVLNIKE